MMKTLRYFLLLAMTAMVSTTFAQKVTFDFDADANTLFGMTLLASSTRTRLPLLREFLLQFLLRKQTLKHAIVSGKHLHVCVSTMEQLQFLLLDTRLQVWYLL